MLGCFSLLLGSLSVQTAALEARLEQGAARRQRQAEDLLASAAQQLVGELAEQHACLLSLPLEHWAAMGTACAPVAVQMQLRNGQVLTESYRLLTWQPQQDGTTAELLLELAGSGQSPPRPRRAVFQVTMQVTASARRVLDLRLQGLRGVGS